MKKAIMFPAAAPTAWSETIMTVDMASRSATPYWKAANVRLLTVFEPAINAPSAPVTPAKKGQTPPTFCATYSAMASGIDAMPAPFMSELI